MLGDPDAILTKEVLPANCYLGLWIDRRMRSLKATQSISLSILVARNVRNLRENHSSSHEQKVLSEHIGHTGCHGNTLCCCCICRTIVCSLVTDEGWMTRWKCRSDTSCQRKLGSSSHVEMCFCISSPNQGRMGWASSKGMPN